MLNLSTKCHMFSDKTHYWPIENHCMQYYFKY